MVETYPASALANVPYPLNYADPLTKGLVGQWLVGGGGGGKAWDRSGRGNHGTLTGFPSPFTRTSGWVDGREGGQSALAVDTSMYVSVGVAANNSFNLGAVGAAGAWIKQRVDPQSSNSGIICYYNEVTGNGFGLYVNLDSFVVAAELYNGDNIGSAATRIAVAGAVNDFSWHHLFMTWNGATFYLYIDGRLAGTDTQGTIDTSNARNPLRIGGTVGGNSFKGNIEDPRVYNRYFIFSEVLALCNPPRKQLRYVPKRVWFGGVGTVLIAFDSASNSGYQAASSTPPPFNHTWTGSNRGIGVDVAILSVPGTTVTGVTYNGVALNLIIGRSTVTAFGRNESWAASASQLGNLAAGTYEVAVTLSAAAVSASTVVSYTGVHQTVPTEGANSAQATNTGVGNDASVALTSTADNCWPHASIATDDSVITANQTSRNNVTGLLGSGANEDTNAAVTPAGVTTLSYSGMGIAATWAMTGYCWRPIAASGGTTLQNLTGTLTTVGALVKMGLQAKTGSVSFSGSRVNQAQQAKTGSVTCSGSLTKSALVVLIGALTLTGATITKIVGKAITGTITLAGSLARAITQALAGAITLTGSLAKLSAKPLTGIVTLAGMISNLVAKALTGLITLSGVLSAFRIVVQSLTGSITLTGATITKLVSKSITVTITLGGTIAKSFLKQLTGAIGLSGLFSYLIPERVSPPVTIDALNFKFTVVDAAEFGYLLTDAIDFNFTTYDAVDFE